MPTFEAKLLEARDYEIALSQWLQKQFGAYIVPTYDYGGLGDKKAPKMYPLLESKGLVLPDLMACSNGKTVWVECKWKSEASFYRKHNIRTTGINARHYKHYRKVKTVSGCKVVIMFLHVAENEMRGAEIDSMPPIDHQYAGGKMGQSGMVFWAYDDIKRWCSLGEVIQKQAPATLYDSGALLYRWPPPFNQETSTDGNSTD